MFAGDLGYFGGIRIIEDINCLEKTQEPRKTHKLKPWMRKSYHARIQKKWIKRWGYEMRPVMYETAHGYICHPSLALKLRNHLKIAKR